MKENTLEVALRKEEVADFVSRFKEEESLSTQHLILLLSEDETWTAKDLKPLVSIAKQHSKKHQKSIAVVSAELVYEGIEIELNLAPTLQEAYDLIEIDEIERDLWK